MMMINLTDLLAVVALGSGVYSAWQLRRLHDALIGHDEALRTFNDELKQIKLDESTYSLNQTQKPPIINEDDDAWYERVRNK